jgi:hypothetical protein
MYYQATITTPANTSSDDPLITRLLLARGLITRIVVGFPPGAAALCHVQIKDKGWQICPWSLAEDLAWDDYVYDMSLRYEMIAEPYEVTVISWNEDDSYEHQVFVGIEIAEGDIVSGLALAQYPLSEV